MKDSQTGFIESLKDRLITDGGGDPSFLHYQEVIAPAQGPQSSCPSPSCTRRDGVIVFVADRSPFQQGDHAWMVATNAIGIISVDEHIQGFMQLYLGEDQVQELIESLNIALMVHRSQRD